MYFSMIKHELTLVEEVSQHRRSYCRFNVRILEDDKGRLSSEFEGQLRTVEDHSYLRSITHRFDVPLRASLLNLLSSGYGSGEGDL